VSHLVEKMFYVQTNGQRDFPWHIQETQDKTTLIDPANRPTTFEEARIPAGLDWEPQVIPNFWIPGAKFKKDGTVKVPKGASPVPAADFKFLARSDNGYILDSARTSYNVISNSDMGLIINTIMDGHDVRYETGGCLDEGRKVWMMLQLGDLVEIPGDKSPHLRYLAVLNSHDGSGSCKVMATNVRIQCANTFHLAETYGNLENAKRKKAGAPLATYSFHHRAQWRKHLDKLQTEVKTAIGGVDRQTQIVNQMFTELNDLRHQVTMDEAKLWVDSLFWNPKDDWLLEEQPATKVAVMRKRESLWGAFTGERCDELPLTPYRLLMATTEWIDHLREYERPATYLNRTVFMREEMKTLAMTRAVELLGAKLAKFRQSFGLAA
jgi:phage/plasmid-like protein (TIGR03299 family)